MLRNNNKRFIRLLSKEYMKANKLRNVIAIAAIILTTAMFASVVTVYQGAAVSIHEQMLYQSGSRFMVSIQNIQKEKSKCIKSNPLFSEVYEKIYLGEVNSGDTILPVLFYYAEQGYLDGSYIDYIAGGYPFGGNEVLVPETYLKQNNISASVGDTILLNYSVNGEMRKKDMQVSGIYKGHPNEAALGIYISKDFYNREMDGIRPAKDNEVKAGSVSLYGDFQDTGDLEGKQEQALSCAGFDAGASYGEAGYINSTINIAYQMDTKPAKQETKMFAVIVILILFAGFLIIFNVFKISVMKDVQIYGQLKTIGACPRQLRKLVEYQALRMAWIGIPTGTFLGWGLGNIFLPFIMSVTTFRDSFLILPDFRIILATAIFSFATVWVSCKIPACIVSRLSPMQSLKYQGRERSCSKTSKRGKESKARILRMAVTNLAENKGRTVLVIISIGLSIVLFNSVLNFTATFNKETYLQGQSSAEFNVFNPTFVAGTRLFFDDTDTLPDGFSKDISCIDGVKNGGFVYFHGRPADVPESKELRKDYCGVVTAKILELNGQPYMNDIVQEAGQALYGFDENVLGRVTVIEGAVDYEKLRTGKFVVEAIISDDNGADFSESMLSAHVGDKISAEIEGKPLDYEVLACVAVNSKLIAPAQPGEASFMVLASEEFLRLFPNKQPVRFICDSQAGMYNQVQSYLDRQILQGLKASYESSRSIGTEFEVFTNVYRMVGNIFAVIFGVLGLLNLLNTIIAGVIARQREFAVMQGIGMTKKQLRKLVVYEGTGFTILSAITGIFVSMVISLTVIKDLTDGFWFCTYRFTVLPAVCISAPYIIFAAMISVFVNRIWNHGTIVEKLRRTR